MKSEKRMEMYKQSMTPPYSEEGIRETILKSQNAFFETEQNNMLTYKEFLWIQLKVIKKRWWFLQVLILPGLWAALNFIGDNFYLKRSMGVMATLFVVLVIPELWKNRSCGCVEIEATSYYSLKQVYAARMMLFGIADVVLLTLFLGVASKGLHFALSELAIQFLFPLCVTACICFGILCSKHSFRESTAVNLCIMWSAVWMLIVLDELI